MADTPAQFDEIRPGYAVSALTIKEAAKLQQLFERCGDFFMLTNGVAPAPDAAQAEFFDTPEGKTTQDIHVFGLSPGQRHLAGAIIAVRHYPDEQTWWIGLMLLAPAYRGQGLGADFYRAFERWLAAQGISYISLCAIAANTSGRQFWQRMGFETVRKTPPRPYGVKTHEVYVYRRAIPPGVSQKD